MLAYVHVGVDSRVRQYSLCLTEVLMKDVYMNLSDHVKISEFIVHTYMYMYNVHIFYVSCFTEVHIKQHQVQQCKQTCT